MMAIQTIKRKSKTLRQECIDYIWRTVSLFSDDVSVYTESTKESSEKLLRLMSLRQSGLLQNTREKNQSFFSFYF